jgi:hypothetical protein
MARKVGTDLSCDDGVTGGSEVDRLLWALQQNAGELKRIADEQAARERRMKELVEEMGEYLESLRGILKSI